jgi:hypothetical protein
MSDRTPSSVRAGSHVGDAAAPNGTAPGEPTPVSATQSIPTGSQPAQAPATGASAAAKPSGAPVAAKPSGAPVAAKPSGAPVAAKPSGAPVAAKPSSAPATATPSATPSGAPTGAPSVPSATGASPFVGSATSASTVQVGDTPAVSGGRVRTGKAGGRGPRRARLQLRHIDTWSALKISLVLSIALFFIWMVAVGILYGVLSALGVFDTLNELFGQLGSASGSDSGGGGDVVTPGVVFGGAAVIGAINIVLMTALCTVGTFIYNLCSDLVGGLELTLSERD